MQRKQRRFWRQASVREVTVSDVGDRVERDGFHQAKEDLEWEQLQGGGISVTELEMPCRHQCYLILTPHHPYEEGITLSSSFCRCDN